MFEWLHCVCCFVIAVELGSAVVTDCCFRGTDSVNVVMWDISMIPLCCARESQVGGVCVSSTQGCWLNLQPHLRCACDPSQCKDTMRRNFVALYVLVCKPYCLIMAKLCFCVRQLSDYIRQLAPY